jgi:hypothetical protein
MECSDGKSKGLVGEISNFGTVPGTVPVGPSLGLDGRKA